MISSQNPILLYDVLRFHDKDKPKLINNANKRKTSLIKKVAKYGLLLFKS